jgi:hypothetical protein
MLKDLIIDRSTASDFTVAIIFSFIQKMDNNCCFVSLMCSVIGLIELTVEIDQFAIYMIKIALINQNTLLYHKQFAKEFLAIMETDSTQKAVVHNVFAGKEILGAMFCLLDVCTHFKLPV